MSILEVVTLWLSASVAVGILIGRLIAWGEE